MRYSIGNDRRSTSFVNRPTGRLCPIALLALQSQLIGLRRRQHGGGGGGGGGGGNSGGGGGTAAPWKID